MIDILVSIVILIIGLTLISLAMWSLMKVSSDYEDSLVKYKGPYAEARKHYVYDPNVDIPVVDIDSLTETPIEKWAEKSKDEKYLEDILESYPKEVSDSAEEAFNKRIVIFEPKEGDLAIISSSIALPGDLQLASQRYCEEYGLDYPFLLAMMETESTFREDIGSEKVLGGEEGGPRYYGYMQLSIDNCKRAEDMGIDAHTPEGNIEYSVVLLADYMDKYNDIKMAVMCYKGGEGAAKAWKETGYVLPIAEKVEERTGYFRRLLYGN